MHRTAAPQLRITVVQRKSSSRSLADRSLADRSLPDRLRHERLAGSRDESSPVADLLPWADPYIAALAARLESDERSAALASTGSSVPRNRIVRAEAQPPVFPWTDYEIFRQPSDRSSDEADQDS